MPSQQHVKEIFTACDRLDGVVGLLYDLARAAEVLGNDRLADTLADAEAYRVKADATAQAESIKKRGDAEADALRAKGAAISANPAIVDLIKAEKWNGTATFIPSSAMQVYGPNK